MRIGVYLDRIKHIAAVGDANASLTWTLLRNARGSQGAARRWRAVKTFDGWYHAYPGNADAHYI